MQQESENHRNDAYSKLMWMALASFLLMYGLMYTALEGLVRAMGDQNAFFMALIFTLPMVIIEVVLLGGLTRSRMINVVVIVLSLFVFFVFYHFVSSRQSVISSHVESR